MCFPKRKCQPLGPLSLSKSEIEDLIQQTKLKIQKKTEELNFLMEALRELEFTYLILFSSNFEVIKKNGTIRFRTA